LITAASIRNAHGRSNRELAKAHRQTSLRAIAG
jgi:hypothetical protein